MLYVNNNINSKVNLAWQWDGQEYITEISANRDIYLKLHARYTEQPKDIVFKGYTADKQNSPILLNGKDSIDIKASKQSGYVPVYVDSAKGILCYFFFLSCGD